MISWLRRIKVTTRIMSLACFLVLVKVSILLFTLHELKLIGQNSHLQLEQVTEQNRWIQQEAELIDAQAHTQVKLQQAQAVQRSYSDMLFWYFDGSVTQYYASLNQAAASADQLEEQLAALALDSEAGILIRPMLENLSSYREIMDSAIQYYQQGRNNLAGAEISDAHIVVQNMNSQLMALTELFQGRLKQANLQVQTAVDETFAASEQVARLSQQSSNSIEHISKLTLMILVVSVPLSILIAVAIISSITRPLKSLQEQLLTIEKQSDLTQDLNLEGQDEIRTMAEATQRLVAKFRTTLNDVDQLASELKTSANKGRGVSQRTHQQSEEQKQLSEMIASTATELGASAEDILRTTDQGLQRVETLTHSAQKGQQDVLATAKTVGELADQFEQVEDSVQTLVKHSASISSVLEVIQDIAEQTNLLALNAAIEAARAGEQGRGFAVVADEVRTLAQRTSQSTDEIQQMVTVLQQQSQQAIESLEHNRSQVDAGVQLSKQAEDSIRGIIRELTALTEVNQSIAIISQEQQQAVSGVDQGVQHILELAHNVATHTSDSKQVSQHLDQMAEQLQQQLQLFKH